ncbi:MAG: hypothetical protein H7X86_00800, partial [Gorillibacterium sp.]|nr:hypothetical protein [Gorillibacterium sp.]
MKSSALLTPTDVKVIRDYVENKYSPLSGERRAEIVADAIRRVLHNHLPELSQRTKDEVTNQLIRSFIFGEQSSIQPEDVLQALSTDPTIGDEIIIETLLSWLNMRTAEDWTRERLESHLQTQEAGRDPKAIEGKRFKGHEEAAAALSVACDTEHPWFYPTLNSFKKVSAGALLMTLLTGTAIGAWAIRQDKDHRLTKTVGVSMALPLYSQRLLPIPVKVIDQGMPVELQYHEIDSIAVKTYLHRRNSLLADEPYFSAIVESARKHDVHPLLLFAITGQEQGFVPKSHE